MTSLERSRELRDVDIALPRAPRIAVIEPHAGSEGGHFSTAFRLIAAALTAAGADASVVIRSVELDGPSLSERTMVLAAHAARRLPGDRARRRRAGEAVIALASLRPELATLEACSGAGRSADAFLLASGAGRPFRLKSTATRGIPLLEMVFDGPLAGRWMVRGLGDWHHLVTTSHRLADAVVACGGRRPPVLCHRPIVRFDARAMSPDVARAAGTAFAAPSGTLLLFGAMHGKKNLPLVADLVDCLPNEVGLLLVGSPLADGREVVARAIRSNHPHIGVVPRAVSPDDLASIFARRPTVWLAERESTESVSGVLMDAIGGGCPVVTRAHCATGDVVDDGRLGAVYGHDIPAAVLDAFANAGDARPDRGALDHHGMLEDEAWGRRVLDILGFGERLVR